jgi:hypothetical protein
MLSEFAASIISKFYFEVKAITCHAARVKTKSQVRMLPSLAMLTYRRWGGRWGVEPISTTAKRVPFFRNSFRFFPSHALLARIKNKTTILSIPVAMVSDFTPTTCIESGCGLKNWMDATSIGLGVLDSDLQ